MTETTPVAETPKATAEAKPKSVKHKTIEDLNAQHITLGLDEIDIDLHPNYRKNFSNDEVKHLEALISRQGQLQESTVVKHESGKYGPIYGFKRIEVQYRRALKQLVSEFNKENGFEKGKGDYVSLNNEKDVALDNRIHNVGYRLAAAIIPKKSLEWERRWNKALSDHKISFKVIEGVSKEQIQFMNIAENIGRTDPPVMDLARRVNEMIDSGMTQQAIAENLRIGGGTISSAKSKVSQYRKIFRLPEVLLTMMTDRDKISEAYNTSNAETIDSEVARAKILVDEFEDRMNFSSSPSNDSNDNQASTADRAITFTAARDIAYAVTSDKDDKKITLQFVFRLIKFVTRVNAGGKPTTEATPAQTDIKKEIVECIKASRAKEEAAKAKEASGALTDTANTTTESTATDAAAIVDAVTNAENNDGAAVSDIVNSINTEGLPETTIAPSVESPLESEVGTTEDDEISELVGDDIDGPTAEDIAAIRKEQEEAKEAGKTGTSVVEAKTDRSMMTYEQVVNLAETEVSRRNDLELTEVDLNY